jgi:hypothetical protein
MPWRFTMPRRKRQIWRTRIWHTQHRDLSSTYPLQHVLCYTGFMTVKYWVRVLYTCCDVTQTWFKYLRGITNGFTEFITNRVLYPPIIRERKKKNISFFFSQPILLSMDLANKGFPHSIWFTNTNSTYTYLRLRLLHRGKGHDHIIKHTGSRLRTIHAVASAAQWLLWRFYRMPLSIRDWSPVLR